MPGQNVIRNDASGVPAGRDESPRRDGLASWADAYLELAATTLRYDWIEQYSSIGGIADMTHSSQSWLKQADHELSFAKYALYEAGYDIAAYLSQKSVETRLKGYIVSSGEDFYRTHNLYHLARHLEELIDYSFGENELERLKDLTTMQVIARYPVDDADMAPMEAITHSRAADCVHTAERWATLLPYLSNEADETSYVEPKT